VLHAVAAALFLGLLASSLGCSDDTFATAVNYPVGSDPPSVAVADLNGDGRPDLVVTNRDTNAVEILAVKQGALQAVRAG